MNILLINHYAGSIEHGRVYRSFYLAREWAKLGHTVTIVAASWTHLRYRQPEMIHDFQEDNLEGVKFIWLKTPKYQGNGVKRAINIFVFVAQLFRYSNKIIKQVRPDVVINTSYPLDTYPAQYIAKKTKAKLIHEVRDIWPLSLIEVGGMSPCNPFIILMQLAENSAYHHADLVVSLLPKAEEHMRSHGMAEGKFVWIPNGISVDEWTIDNADLPASHQRAIAEAKQAGLFTVGFTGAYGISNTLSTVLKAAFILKNKPVIFLLVGQGPEKERLQQQASELELNNAVFLPTVAKELIPTLLDELDCLLITIQKQPVFRFGISPNKLMDYMMAAKPIISSISAGNDPVAENGCGISVSGEDHQAIANAIESLMAMSGSERAEMGIKGQQYVINNHDYRVLAEKYLQIMKRKTA
jgi:glycosyltransferase involved in cell wall biosynthesis